MDNDQVEEFSFSPSDAWHIASILRGALLIRTAAGEEDDVLSDFIEALEDADVIFIEEADDDDSEPFDAESNDSNEVFPFFFGK